MLPSILPVDFCDHQALRNAEGKDGYLLDTPIVSFQDVLDDGIGATKEVGLSRVGALHLLFE